MATATARSLHGKLHFANTAAITTTLRRTLPVISTRTTTRTGFITVGRHHCQGRLSSHNAPPRVAAAAFKLSTANTSISTTTTGRRWLSTSDDENVRQDTERVGSGHSGAAAADQPSSAHHQEQHLQQQHQRPPKSPSTPSAPKTPVTRSLDAAREHSRTVRNKVRSSLTSLTPHENIYNLPNFLTVTRLVAAPATAYLLLHDHHAWALALFAYAGITDLVDGWLARRWKLQTVAGSVIDPMADKALMIILTVTLALKGAIPLYLATLILGRDASLALAAIYYRYASLPAPKTFLRYWDFSLPSAEVHPTTVSKYNTLLQLVLIGSTLALPVVASQQSLSSMSSDQLHAALHYFQWLVAATTAWSGLSYAYLKNVVTILGSNEELKRKQGARGRAIIGVSFGACVVAAVWLAVNVDGKEVARIDEDEQEPAKQSIITKS